MQPCKSFVLAPSPPFRLDLTVWVLRRRPDNIVDRWDGRTYRRILIDKGKPFEIAAIQLDNSESPRLQITVTGDAATSDKKAFVSTTVERLLGIHIDLAEFYCLGKKDKLLRVPINQFLGAKPPRFPTYFETLVNAIACQQISLTVGIRLLNRLTEAFGSIFETDEGIFHSFPCPEDLANVDADRLRRLGLSYQKARYIIGLARGITEGQIILREIEKLDDKMAMKYLCDLKGVGRWTAEYFLLRGLGRTHIFPGDDVGARNHLRDWLQLSEPMTYDNVRKVIRHWSGFGGLIYFNLLLKSLTEKGIIKIEEDNANKSKTRL